MIKRKFYLKDIKVGDAVANQCFTDESFITVKIPSVKEKISISDRLRGSEDNQVKNIDMIESLLADICCYPLDSEDEVVTNFDDLSCYADSLVIINFVTELMRNGFVPKKA
jgi:hypothetical protein